jgi:hypothetical protein
VSAINTKQQELLDKHLKEQSIALEQHLEEQP